MHVANFDDAMLASIGGLKGIQISLKEIITLSSLGRNQKHSKSIRPVSSQRKKVVVHLKRRAVCAR